MSSEGGNATQPKTHGGERFYNRPSVRRHHHQIPLQPQQHRHHHQIPLQPQQHRQQQMAQRHLLQHQQEHQRPMQRRMVMNPESSSRALAAEAEKRKEAYGSSMAVALPIPRSLAPPPALKITNLDRFMESVTPFISSPLFSEMNSRGQRTRGMDPVSLFCLEDLWESFHEWSAYGAGVPLLINGKHPIEQYYVPFLSGIELYLNPSKASSRLRLNGREAESTNSSVRPIFQFLEHEQPRNRRPLSDKMSILVTQFPQLSKLRCCDLLPESWLCVAWYPIYRIPMGPTLQDLDASFLTFHSLSMQAKNNHHPQFHAPKTKKFQGGVDPNAKISLPVFGLVSYKLKGSIVGPCGPHECEQESSLLQAADNWLRQRQVTLPDYQFFRAHYSHWRR